MGRRKNSHQIGVSGICTLNNRSSGAGCSHTTEKGQLNLQESDNSEKEKYAGVGEDHSGISIFF